MRMPPRTARSSEEKGGSTRSSTPGRSRETVAHHRKRSALRGSDHSPEVMASARAEATTCIRGEVPFRLSKKAVPGGLRSPGHRRETTTSAVALVFRNRVNAQALTTANGNPNDRTAPDGAPRARRCGIVGVHSAATGACLQTALPRARRAGRIRVLSRDQLMNRPSAVIAEQVQLCGAAS